LGTWGVPVESASADVVISGVGYDIAFVASLDESRNLKVVEYDSGKATREYIAHSTVLAGRLYLSLELTGYLVSEGVAGDPEQPRAWMSDMEVAQCSYQIVRYSVDSRPRISDEKWNDEYAQHFTKYEGRWLSVNLMDSNFVENAIEQGLVDGESDCYLCIWLGPCINAEPEEIQRFVKKYDAQLYPQDSWSALMGLPSTE